MLSTRVSNKRRRVTWCVFIRPVSKRLLLWSISKYYPRCYQFVIPGRFNVMKYIWQEVPDLTLEKKTWKVPESLETVRCKKFSFHISIQRQNSDWSILTMLISQSAGQSISQSVSWSVSRVSQLVSQLVSQSASQSVSQWVSQSVSESVSHFYINPYLRPYTC